MSFAEKFLIKQPSKRSMVVLDIGVESKVFQILGEFLNLSLDSPKLGYPDDNFF